MFLDDDEERLVDWLTGLRPEVRAAQLLMVAPEPGDDPAAVVDWLAGYQYGGLFLQWKHLGDREWVLELGERLREMTDESPPPLLATDEEGGLVSDLAGLTTTGPSPAALGALNEAQLTYGTAVAVGEKLKALGFNTVFAPCLDIDSEPRNPVIGTRAFGGTPDAVLRHGLAWLEGLARTGVVACAKHFPGHGATRLDSHLTLPEVGASLETLRRREMIPFRAAIDRGVPMVMTAHVAYPALDPVGGPATLSPEILTEILREELGFTGVICSDGMEMKGVAGLADAGTLAIQALEAGVDLLLYAQDREMAAEVADRLGRAMRRGELSEERVNESLLRLGRLRLAIAAGEEGMDDSTREEILDYQHEALLRQVSAEGITLLGGAGPELPLRWERRRGLWVLPTGVEPRLKVDVGRLRDLVEPLGMELFTTSLRPGESERDAALRRAAGADYVVACTLSRGPLSAEQRRLVDALATGGRPVILVALLNPHDLADFPLVPTRLATYGFGPLVLDGLVDVLLGKAEANEGPPPGASHEPPPGRRRARAHD